MGHGKLTGKGTWELRKLRKSGRGFGDPRVMRRRAVGRPKMRRRRVLGILTFEEQRGLGKARMEVQGLPGPKKRGDLEPERNYIPGEKASLWGRVGGGGGLLLAKGLQRGRGGPGAQKGGFMGFWC